MLRETNQLSQGDCAVSGRAGIHIYTSKKYSLSSFLLCLLKVQMVAIRSLFEGKGEKF